MALRDNMKKIRTMKGVRVEAVAHVLGQTEGNYRHYEMGRQNIPGGVVTVVAEFLGVPEFVFYDDFATDEYCTSFKERIQWLSSFKGLSKKKSRKVQ